MKVALNRVKIGEARRSRHNLGCAIRLERACSEAWLPASRRMGFPLSHALFRSLLAAPIITALKFAPAGFSEFPLRTRQGVIHECPSLKDRLVHIPQFAVDLPPPAVVKARALGFLARRTRHFVPENAEHWGRGHVAGGSFGEPREAVVRDHVFEQVVEEVVGVESRLIRLTVAVPSQRLYAWSRRCSVFVTVMTSVLSPCVPLSSMNQFMD